MIRFDADRHTYTVDGVPVPSVTTIISMLFPNKYADVPEDVLKNAADYGNRVHDWIENYCLTGKKKRQSEYMKLSTLQAVELLEERKAEIRYCEQIVSYKTMYVGTYDMYGLVDGKLSLIDIKTTASYDEEYLRWQLGMYKLAVESEGKKVEQCLCLWLPKGSSAYLLEVTPKSEYDIEWLVYRYEQEHTAGQ